MYMMRWTEVLPHLGGSLGMTGGGVKTLLPGGMGGLPWMIERGAQGAGVRARGGLLIAQGGRCVLLVKALTQPVVSLTWRGPASLSGT